MNLRAGVVFALIALFGWAFGDFFIQRTVRAMNWYKALFLIGIAGFVGLAPFAVGELSRYSLQEFLPLAGLSVIVLMYAWALFEALRVGKISVVASVVAIELPFTVTLGVLLAGDSFNLTQALLFLLICAGIVLASTRQFEHFKDRQKLLEKGVLLAFFGAFLSALTNFYVGAFSQTMSPIVIIWIVHSSLALMCGMYMLAKGEFASFGRDIRRNPLTSLATATFDNAAWVGYAYATSLMSISFVVTISESYIALAAILGWLFGRERLRWHQFAGAVLAFTGAAILSTTL